MGETPSHPSLPTLWHRSLEAPTMPGPKRFLCSLHFPEGPELAAQVFTGPLPMGLVLLLFQ